MSITNIKTGVRPEAKQVAYRVAYSSRTKTGFNGEGQIRLSDYDDMEPVKQHRGTFIGYDWIDLSKINISDKEYFNMAIRDEADDDRIQDLSNDFNISGWSTAFFPPVFGTDGLPRDGRGRIIAAIQNGERWMPKAIYEYEDDSERSKITNGLKANRHKPATPSKMKNFINGGVTLVATDELECNMEKIYEWLYDEVEITDFFTNIGGHITKIANKIYELGSKDEIKLVHRVPPKQWRAWVDEHYGTDVHLMSVDNNQYLFRTWGDHVREAVRKGTQPVKVIFYTNETSPDSVRNKMSIRMRELEDLYKMCFDVVNASVEGIHLKPKPGAERPWKVLGAVPQIIGDHDIGSVRLVDIDEY